MDDFLGVPRDSWLCENELAFAIEDRFPVSPGHALVIPKRKVATWFDASREEQLSLLELVDEVKARLDRERAPAGYNVGFNSGAAAGQTVMHLHVHVIPRYQGDMDDPRGGVRHVIPGRGNYLQRAAALSTGGAGDPFLEHLRPLAARAREVAVVAAFVKHRGLALIKELLLPALSEGARVRILTGDYMNCTEPEALEALLSWCRRVSEGDPGDGEADGGRAGAAASKPASAGCLEARVVEVALLPAGGRAFHPKSWRFEGPGLAAAFVGSSNMSRTALLGGVEWNLRIDRDWDCVAYDRVARAFEDTWQGAQPLTSGWIAAYARRYAASTELPRRLAEEDDQEDPPGLPTPHSIQRQALAALAEARRAGHRRALVVLATGLGKTLLAAFDVAALQAERGVRPRVLFIAHREELLHQARSALRRVLPATGQPLRFSSFAGERDDLSGDVVLASVQKLALPSGLARLEQERPFDYVIVDEVHHAAASSYQKILGRIAPLFLLGLTATPERADGVDISGSFDGFTAFRADLGAGIEAGHLVPFAYHGLADDVDYSAQRIPWRGRRFEPAALSRALSTSPRMERLWTAWQEHRGERTLVFCCTIEHAAFARDWLRGKGVRAEVVHSGEGSYDRRRALAQLADGSIEALCTVDLFNEGVDVPDVDRVVLLRPTESPVVFLQQLGRGLRTARGKERLTVIDFVGNHRLSLLGLRTLLQAAGGALSIESVVAAAGPLALPGGCLVDVALEAKAILSALLPSGRAGVERVYDELRLAWGRRPTPSELLERGHLPGTLRDVHGGWFQFVSSKGDLDPDERRVLEAGRLWFQDFEATPMTRCFKMVVLEVLLDAGALRDGLGLEELARRSHEMLLRSPELFSDIEDVKELPEPRDPPPRAWLAYWRGNPVAAWAGEGRDDGRRRWFRVEGGRLVPQLPIPEGAEESFAAMTRELVEYRLARYRDRRRRERAGASIECKVTWNQRDPILKLPSRASRGDLPGRDTAVRLPTGDEWRFDFAKEYCNVARLPGGTKNQLPRLLRRWFGEDAGRPGTAFQVRFSKGDDGWSVWPVQEAAARRAVLRPLPTYPTLRAAAGPPAAGEGAPEVQEVLLPVDRVGEGLFAVRATGDSMDGGKRPIRDGDWLVMRHLDGVGLGAVEDQVALLEVPGAGADLAYQVKRVQQREGAWWLTSDNPARESYAATKEARPVAVLVQVVPAEAGVTEGEAHAD